ncbi:DHA2 family efflux MFS transporter permease subunit [Variovorax ginsengisoli]|uniref:EmrB/QacA subfamily drug resistance transporter n=1 Tax=Variovorax ginsengisoli TaxID=363844 RepID=A0ABT9S242_9BURK|nr:DHA2 family efflux MFS transporter permease subunit [Variovorax ginsengisoli]MDP9898416.1 EmrB/QacA subfamily drug resistance transporter [Variovorax ginsengisoli]
MNLSQDASGVDSNSPSVQRLDPHLLRVMGVIVLGALMSTLDTTVINVAIRGLTKAFESPLETAQWISTGYMLSLTAVIPLSGWAADRFGTKRLFMVSIVLFLVGSALSGCAWSMPALIVFRVLQGLGGGMILPAGMILLSQTAGPRRMGRVMGIVGVPVVIGPVLGPSLGGWLVDEASWRWIFFINLPIGALALYAAYRVLTADQPKSFRPLDWRGLLLLSPGLAVFVYGMAKATAVGGLGSIDANACVLLGVVMISAFVLHARRFEGALIDVRLFARRTVGAAALTSFLLGAAFFGLSLLVPLYLQMFRGYSPFATGMLVAAEGVGAMLAMPIASILTDRIAAGRVVLVGIACIAVAVLMLSALESTTPLWIIELALFILGLGKGATMMPATSAAMSSLRKHEIARATSGLNALQCAGGALGAALLSVVLTRGMARLAPEGRGVAGSAFFAEPGHAAPAWLGLAFSHTFLCALAVVALGGCAAVFLLKGRAVSPVDLDGDRMPG